LRRSAGSRTAFDVLKARFRAPSAESALADKEALSRGEGRAVTCWLKGASGAYPNTLKQGTLELLPGEIRWRSFWGLRPRTLVIDSPIRSLQVGAPGGKGPSVKKGGRAFGVLPVPEFKAIAAETDQGALEFVVPSADLDLVTSALRRADG
jgi:hypothetical protein